MILPSKHLTEERALIALGADILESLVEPVTVSRLWTDVRARRSKEKKPVSFDWFVLTLDMLHAVGALTLKGTRVVRAQANRVDEGEPSETSA